ncbi:hypothetical protein [Mucilaginibacter sp. FT3.2]|uniref:hypothetical protein n=1 Tax=Mucilaginibacter sp. FT3.2 TaxID=2723090 RepID=UPI001618DABE|nr:hypothetical protein [Mucilaginibacter sp. FT3.2]MBB6231284.1 hypothetical protein [Mucilaginibacter sp. FT3.2]
MYKYITLLLIVAIFSGCHKINDNNPTPAPTTPTNTAGSYDVKFDVADQTVTTTVKHDTLYLTYHEKVTLMLNPDDFSKSSAVHFKEDFSKTGLTAYDYKILNEDNVYRYNSADDNLNNNTPFIVASTVTVNGIKYTKLVLQRDFIFYKAYKLQQLAIEAQTNVLNTTADKISFSTYYYYDKKNSDPKVTIAAIVYSKAD